MSSLPQFLPGKLVFTPGSASDYASLAPYHYCARRPATFALIRAIRYLPRRRDGTLDEDRPRLAAVGVLSYPTPSCTPRERVLGTLGQSQLDRLRVANQRVRTISRVIVHPQFRSLGLASEMVRHLCALCPTQYVEALARMGQVHPMFERAGMKRVVTKNVSYFWWERVG
jgi:GNAT superfamily N-acetyltransferase